MKVEIEKVAGDLVFKAKVEGRVDHVIDVLCAVENSYVRESGRDPDMLSMRDIISTGDAPKFKIVGVSNHGLETVSDHIWLENIPCYETAMMVRDKLNKSVTDDSPSFYKVMDQDSKIYKQEI